LLLATFIATFIFGGIFWNLLLVVTIVAIFSPGLIFACRVIRNREKLKHKKDDRFAIIFVIGLFIIATLLVGEQARRQARDRDELSAVMATFQKFQGEIANGPNEVRVRNPNRFAVTVSLRSFGKGKDFAVKENSSSSVLVPDGTYDVFFVYSTDPNSLYRGDTFTLQSKGVEIQIVQVANGNYGIRRVE
jgi:hypothetical protein